MVGPRSLAGVSGALLLTLLCGCAAEVESGRHDLGQLAADRGQTRADLAVKSDRGVVDLPGGNPDKKALNPDQRRPDAGFPNVLNNITLFVNLGDSLAAGHSASSGNSYRALLEKNNDLLYPGYRGKDLKSRFPGIKVINRAKSGATTKDVAKQAANVSGNPLGNTLVVISAGGNDFNDNFLTMVNPIQTAAVAQAAVTNLGKITAHFANRARFPGQVIVALLHVHDPTDGTGVLPAVSGLSGFCKVIQKAGLLIGPLAVANLGSFNARLTTFGAANTVLMVANHTEFLGHGYFFNDPKSKNYRPKDPTLWFHNDCAHLNNRGHHELRRLIWRRLTGQ